MFKSSNINLSKFIMPIEPLKNGGKGNLLAHLLLRERNRGVDRVFVYCETPDGCVHGIGEVIFKDEGEVDMFPVSESTKHRHTIHNAMFVFVSTFTRYNCVWTWNPQLFRVTLDKGKEDSIEFHVSLKKLFPMRLLGSIVDNLEARNKIATDENFYDVNYEDLLKSCQ